MRLFILCFFILLTSQQLFSQESKVSKAYFDFDRSALTEEARSELDNLIAEYKNSGAGSGLTIKGYCDAHGTDAYNDRLSRQRALSVKNYLEQHGITSKEILLWKGYGEKEALNSNSTAEERQLNRRVEVAYSTSTNISASTTTTNTASDPPLNQQIEKVKTGESINLRNINFYGGRHTFLRQSEQALADLLDVMKSHPALVIEIQGHICCRIGLDEDGEDFDSGDNLLSKNRARAVYEYLLQNGIDAGRMSYKGLAGKIPLVNPEVTEADRTLNRRVEIKVISK